MVVDTGVLTFAPGANTTAPPDSTTVWLPGDEIEIDVGGNTGKVRFRVSKAPSATTLQLNNLKNLELVDEVHVFRRIRKATIKDSTSRHMTEFEITWQPPLSIFKVGHAMPSGKYELVLNPQTASVYKKYAIQSVGGNKIPNLNYKGQVPSAGSQFQFEVDTMYMYVNTVEGPRYDDGTFLLDLEQTNCASEKIESVSFAQRNFDVSPSTYALSVAYQDIRAGNDTRCSTSQFKSYNAAVDSEEELKLNREEHTTILVGLVMVRIEVPVLLSISNSVVVMYLLMLLI